jgi:hypothetical protein
MMDYWQRVRFRRVFVLWGGGAYCVLIIAQLMFPVCNEIMIVFQQYE